MKKQILVASLFFSFISVGSMATFSDVPNGSVHFAAVESLKNLDIVKGFPDGTFQPNNPVTRAEALKIILLSAEVTIPEGIAKNTGFADVSSDAWYSQYTLVGKQSEVIKGYGNTGKFMPNNQVTKAEFLKMIFQAFQIDTSKHQNLKTGISADTSAGEWYLPFMSYGKTIGVISPDVNNNLHPNAPQSRADCAEIIYKLLVIERGGESQKMLNITESHLVNVLVALNANDISTALKSANDAVFFSEKALKASSDEGIVIAANKIANGFQKLCLAYQSGIDGNGDALVTYVQEAKNLAGQAFDAHNSTQSLGKKIKTQGDLLLKQVQEQIAEQ